MWIKSSKVSRLVATIRVSGDKSISHRALILGAIAEGMTRVDGFLYAQDCLATLEAIKQMGVGVSKPSEQSLLIHGAGLYGLKKPCNPIDCGNSGTTMRLLAGLLAAQPFDSVLIGDASLQKRPMNRISIPLKKMMADIVTEEDHAPIRIKGHQSLQGIKYILPQASAQVKSCLLLAGLYAKGQTSLSEPTVTRDHTENMLKTFSYPIFHEKGYICLQGGGRCMGTSIKIPGDFSSAAFYIVAAAIIPNSDLMIREIGINPTRIGLLHILKRMGADITLYNEKMFGYERVADIRVRFAPLRAIKMDAQDTALIPSMIDEFPILFIAAALADGQSEFRGLRELRYKESDRLTVMMEGLNRLGIFTKPIEDGLIITGGAFSGGCIDSYHDHRVAMAFAIAGLRSVKPIIIEHAESIYTSFPDFIAIAKITNLSIEDYD